MKPYIPVLIALLAATPAAAQTYKWVDERGVTNYGTKPPAGRPPQPVDTQQRNTIDTNDAQLARETEAKRRADLKVAPPPPPRPPAAAAVRGMDFDTFIRLQRGMSEGELLQRAGRPDYLALENARNDIQKSLYWYPTVSDPFTTVITVRGGRIETIERTKKF